MKQIPKLFVLGTRWSGTYDGIVLTGQSYSRMKTDHYESDKLEQYGTIFC